MHIPTEADAWLPLRLGQSNVRFARRVVVDERVVAQTGFQQKVGRDLPVVLQILGMLYHPYAGRILENILAHEIAGGPIRVGIGRTDVRRNGWVGAGDVVAWTLGTATTHLLAVIPRIPGAGHDRAVTDIRG